MKLSPRNLHALSGTFAAGAMFLGGAAIGAYSGNALSHFDCAILLLMGGGLNWAAVFSELEFKQSRRRNSARSVDYWWHTPEDV